MKDILPDSCFMAFRDEANIKSSQSSELNNCTTHLTTGDDTLVTDSMGNSFAISHVNTIQQLAKAASTVDEFVESFHSITDKEIEHIEQITLGKAENEILHIQR